MSVDPDEAAVSVADAVLAHPDVLRLDVGPFGTITSHLVGRSVAGVRIGLGAEPTQVAVVVALGTPFPRLADEIADRVRTVLGPTDVEVTFADVGAPRPPGPTAPPGLA